MSQQSILQKTKKRLWPIDKDEKKIVLYICLLKGLISSVYCILSNLKDAIVIGTNNSGAEVIPILKGFIVLPVSILFVLIYTKLRNKFKSEAVFYGIMFFFVIAFLIYALILLPFEKYLMPEKSAKLLLSHLGQQNKHWVAAFLNWPRGFFYLISDLWSQAAIFVLFWDLVNRICTIDLAKRSYNLFTAAGSIFNISTSIILFSLFKYLRINYKLNIEILLFLMIFIIISIIKLYSKIIKGTNDKIRKEKTKLGVKESLIFIFKSKYLINIAITVISVGLTINLVEITWKANVRLLYENEVSLISFMTKLNVLIHVFSILIVLFFSGNMLRKYSWKTNASIAPIIIVFTGTIFFLSSKYRNQLGFFSQALNISSIKLIVYLGGFQVLASKITKFAFYDLTKEIAYIPLDRESKVKGKAAIDSIGSRFGKSGSSYIHLFVLWISHTSSVLDVTSILIPILLILGVLWLIAISNINKKLKKVFK